MRTKWIGWKELKMSYKIQYILCCILTFTLIILMSLSMMFFMMSPNLATNPVNLDEVFAKDWPILEKFLQDQGLTADEISAVKTSWNNIITYSKELFPSGVINAVTYNDVLAHQNDPRIATLINNLYNEIFGDNIVYYYYADLTVPVKTIYLWFQKDYVVNDGLIFFIVDLAILFYISRNVTLPMLVSRKTVIFNTLAYVGYKKGIYKKDSKATDYFNKIGNYYWTVFVVFLSLIIITQIVLLSLYNTLGYISMAIGSWSIQLSTIITISIILFLLLVNIIVAIVNSLNYNFFEALSIYPLKYGILSRQLMFSCMNVSRSAVLEKVFKIDTSNLTIYEIDSLYTLVCQEIYTTRDYNFKNSNVFNESRKQSYSGGAYSIETDNKIINAIEDAKKRIGSG